MNKKGLEEDWRGLDNTAKIFPVIAGTHLSSVYRISAVLKHEIIPGLLQQALENVLPQFDGYRVKLKKGFFWYYFESNKKIPFVEEESPYPCKYIDPKSNAQFLFRFSYFKNRINLEIFHAVTDGQGAVRFLKGVLYEYLDLKNQKKQKRLIQQETLSVEDSYLKYYKRVKPYKYSIRPAYHLKGKFLPAGQTSIYKGILNLSQIKDAGKRHGVSVTKYLVSVLIWSVYQEYQEYQAEHGEQQMRSPIGISLPVNLRPFFDSETMSNFFAVTLIDFLSSSDMVTFQEVLKTVDTQMNEKITKEKLEKIISFNVSNEKKWYLRIVPLVIKSVGANWIFKRNDKAYTMTLSNVGLIHTEPEYQDEIKRFEMMIGVSPRQPVKCAVCSYGNQMAVTFTSVYDDTRIQDRFFSCLTEFGVTSVRESNGLPDGKYNRNTYPEGWYQAEKWKKILRIFYGGMTGVSLLLGIVNLATDTAILWSLLVIGGMIYTALTMKYSILRHGNLASKLMVQILAADLLLLLVDYTVGYEGWAINYAIPATFLFADVAIVCMILINRRNWQSYFMYQIAVTIFSMIPVILWQTGQVTKPWLAIMVAVAAMGLLFGMFLFRDRSVKRELKRRFHI